MRTLYFAAVVSIFFSLSSFFLAYFQSETAFLPYFHARCGLSANLECISEMHCTWLTENTGCKNYAKTRHLHTIVQLCWAISLQLRYVSTIKKIVKQQYLHMFSQCGELQPTNSWDWLTSMGNPSKFQPVSRLGFVTAPTSLNGSQRIFAWYLAVSWAGTLYTFLGAHDP